MLKAFMICVHLVVSYAFWCKVFIKDRISDQIGWMEATKNICTKQSFEILDQISKAPKLFKKIQNQQHLQNFRCLQACPRKNTKLENKHNTKWTIENLEETNQKLLWNIVIVSFSCPIVLRPGSAIVWECRSSKFSWIEMKLYGR
jgi:hypothetical protein